MKLLFRRVWYDDQAQDTTEYALLLLLITVGLVAAVGALRNQIVSVYNSVVSALTPSS